MGYRGQRLVLSGRSGSGAGCPPARCRGLVGRGGPPGAAACFGMGPAVQQFPQQAGGAAVTWLRTRVLPAVTAGLAVALAATSLTGVLAGSRWWGYVVLTIAVVVAAGAPACAGLVLLCVIIVPIAASDRMLPWWSFALSALGYALLLAVDSRRRQPAWGQSTSSGSWIGAVPAAAVAVAGSAMVVALVVGATVTAVGTGRSIHTGAASGRPLGGIGLNPFISLRGQLSAGDAVP